MPTAFRGPFLGVVEVEDGEHVREAVLLNGTEIGEGIGGDVVVGCAHVGGEVPGFPEVLVHIGHYVCISLRVVRTRLGVMAVVAAVGYGGVGGSVELLGVEAVRVVDAHAARYVQPRGGVVRGRKRQHVTFFIRLPQVAVGNPVRVLHAQVAALKIGRPELLHELGCGVVALEKPVGAEILASREQIGGDHGVRVNALVHHVPVLLDDVACGCIQAQLVAKEPAGVAEGEVVAVVDVVGNYTVRIHCRCAEIGLVTVRSAAEGE